MNVYFWIFPHWLQKKRIQTSKVQILSKNNTILMFFCKFNEKSRGPSGVDDEPVVEMEEDRTSETLVLIAVRFFFNRQFDN